MDAGLARAEREAEAGRLTDYALGVERLRAGRCPACGGPTDTRERVSNLGELRLDSLKVTAHERAMQLALIAGTDQNDPAIARIAQALLPVDDMACAGEDDVPGVGRVAPCGWSLSAGWSNPDDPQPGDPGFVAIGSDVYPVTIIRRTRMTLFVARDVPVHTGPQGGRSRLSFMPTQGVATSAWAIVLDLFTRRKDGTWKRGAMRSGPQRLTAGYRQTYTDPHR